MACELSRAATHCEAFCEWHLVATGRQQLCCPPAAAHSALTRMTLKTLRAAATLTCTFLALPGSPAEANMAAYCRAFGMHEPDSPLSQTAHYGAEGLHNMPRTHLDGSSELVPEV